MNVTNSPPNTAPALSYRHQVVRALASTYRYPNPALNGRRVGLQTALREETSSSSRSSDPGQSEPSPNRKPASPLTSSLVGVVRGVAAQIFFYPFDTIKTRQQAAEQPLSARAITALLIKEGGWGAFYKGFLYKTAKTAVKQAFCWPLITGLPPCFNQLGAVEQQLVTGLVVAQVDALVSKHLDGLQIRSMVRGKTATLSSLSQAGHGYLTYLGHLTIAWSASLAALKWFELKEVKNGEKLTPLQTAQVGVSAGLFSSCVSAPFDAANTVKQARGLSLGTFVRQQGFSALLRGLPLRTGVIVGQNVVSAFTIRELV